MWDPSFRIVRKTEAAVRKIGFGLIAAQVATGMRSQGPLPRPISAGPTRWPVQTDAESHPKWLNYGSRNKFLLTIRGQHWRARKSTGAMRLQDAQYCLDFW